MAIFELRCGSGLPIIWWIPAPEEYHKYQEATLSPVEQTYLETIKETGEAVKQELKKKRHPPLTHNLTQNRKKTVEIMEQRRLKSIWFRFEDVSKVPETYKPSSGEQLITRRL